MKLPKHTVIVVLVVIGLYLLYRLYNLNHQRVSQASYPLRDEYLTSQPLSKKIVYSYSPSCGHCIKFSPVWDKFAAIVANRGDGTVTEKINCATSPDRCVGIHGVPDIAFYKNGVKTSYNGDRTTSALINFLDSM